MTRASIYDDTLVEPEQPEGGVASATLHADEEAFAKPPLRERIEELAALDETEYYEFRKSTAKTYAVPVAVLDRLVRTERASQSGESEPDGRGPKQADVLIEIAAAADLFATSSNEAYADIRTGGHRETWPVRSKGFKLWLGKRYYEDTASAPNSEALQTSLNVIEAKALAEPIRRDINVRVAGHDGKLYVDLSNAAWQAVEIDETGWRIVDEPPVRFRRSSGMKPLPMPEPGGSVDMLRPFLNVQSECDFVLIVSWMLAALRDEGPYPLIVLSGEQGSAKSTFSAVLRATLDPNIAPLRSMPGNDKDLLIAARNGHVLTFDNLSNLPGWVSDTLCRLATGAGFACRQLYTDQDEVIIDASRPICLNGIDDIVSRPDLADRAILLTLEPIPDEKRRLEKEIWADFRKAHPQILGALLDAVAVGLQRLPHTKLPRLPRMADFASWASACEAGLWPEGTFWEAYDDNREDAVDSVIDADPVASCIRALMVENSQWKGTATVLLKALADLTDDASQKSRAWPRTAKSLGGRVRRAATFLRKTGIDIRTDRGPWPARARLIIIEKNQNFALPDYGAHFASRSSSASSDDEKDSRNSSVEPGRKDDDLDENSGHDKIASRACVQENRRKIAVLDALDDLDAKKPTQSGNGLSGLPSQAITDAFETEI